MHYKLIKLFLTATAYAELPNAISNKLDQCLNELFKFGFYVWQSVFLSSE